MSEKYQLVYARYRKIMKAFPRSVHSGFGSAELICPYGTETRKEQYAELVDNIVENLEGIPLMFSEVAMRERLTMKYKDPMHQEDMARNMQVQVEIPTDAKVIAEFLQTMEVLGRKYEHKTYTSPCCGIVDKQNAKDGFVNSSNPNQKEINDQLATYVETASITLIVDHVFGERIEIPGDPNLDPRELSAQQWFAKDWKLVHEHRVPAVRQTETGETIKDRADQTAHPHQREQFQPMIFKNDHLFAHEAYLEGQRISRDKK